MRIPELVITLLTLAIVVSVPATDPVLGLHAVAVGKTRVQLDDGDLGIYGRVMRPGTREPVPGAEVQLRGPGTSRATLTFTTQGDGTFGFSGLAAGEYLLSPVLPGRLGLRSRDAWGRTIEVSGNGPPPDVNLWMTSISVISGTVSDQDGEPFDDVFISASSAVWLEGRTVLRHDGFSGVSYRTGDGTYRLRLLPGEYFLRADFRGDLVPPFFYPGTFDVRNAVPVRVAAGLDLAGIDLRAPDEPKFRVRFRMSLPEFVPGVPEPVETYLRPEEEQPLEVRVRPIQEGPGVTLDGSSKVHLERLADDEWLTPGLGEGDYEFLLRYPSTLGAALRRAASERDDPDTPNPLRFNVIARFPVRIVDSDVDLGTVTPDPKTQIPGRVVLRTERARDVAVGELQHFAFADTAYPNDGLATGAIPVVPSENGSFLLREIHRGRFRLEVAPNGMPVGWYVDSVTRGGLDVLRNGMEVGGGPAGPIEIVVSDGAGEVSGVVRNEDDSLVPDARVILIPPVNRRGPLLRFPTVEAEPSGAYALAGIAPGSYRLLALDVAGLDTGTPDTPWWEDPEFLRRYELRGERIMVDPNASMNANLEAVPYLP